MATSTLQAEKTLLWTNPNPTSAFASQSVRIDGLSNYSLILIIPRYSSNGSNGNIAPIITEAGDNGLFVCPYGTGHATRRFEVYTGSISFADAAVTGGTDNTMLIPYYIYGIK